MNSNSHLAAMPQTPGPKTQKSQGFWDMIPELKQQRDDGLLQALA